jgi:hypothetical protein
MQLRTVKDACTGALAILVVAALLVLGYQLSQPATAASQQGLARSNSIANVGTGANARQLLAPICNSGAISIPGTGSSGPASPYPSVITATGLSGVVVSMTVTFNGLSHSRPDDIDALLVGPGGQTVMLMSDAGGSTNITGINVTFDDAALNPLPDDAQIVSATYQPTNYIGEDGPNDSFVAPAPSPPYGSALSVFNGTNPNGAWSLYVYDDLTGSLGSMSGGWCLNITTGLAPTATATATPVPPTSTRTATSGAPTFTGTATPVPPTSTRTATGGVPTFTGTATPVLSPTRTATSTVTGTVTPGSSPTRTPTGTTGPSNTPTRTATNTPTATSTPCLITFNDVPPGSTFYTWIRCLACRGIVGGYPCGGPGEPCPGNYYRPNNNVTRGQVSKIVSESAGFNDPVPSTQQTFEDVPPGSTFWVWIERLASRGIIQGYPCGGPFEPCVAPTNRPYFRPNNNATRGQMAKIAAEAFFPNCQTPARRQ